MDERSTRIIMDDKHSIIAPIPVIEEYVIVTTDANGNDVVVCRMYYLSQVGQIAITCPITYTLMP